MDTTQKLPTVLSLCTGYGGIERGLDLAGVEHRVIAHVEIEAFAIANLVAKMEASELDAAPVWSNLKTLPVDCFRDRVDILTGGYPCQPFSAAGKRLGEEDPRHLWPYIKEIIRAVRPVRCFFENVEGHVSLGLREVISDLESLGYTTAWGIFSAREVGAPHQRKRVYIMAYSSGQRSRDHAGQTADEGGESSSERRETLRQSDREERAVRVVATGKDGANSVADSSDPRSSRTGIESQHSNEIVEPCDSNSKRESGEDLADSNSNQQRSRVRQEQSERDTAGQCPSDSGSVGIEGVADTIGTRGGEGGISSQRTNGSKFVSNGQAGGVDLADSKDFRLQRPSETRDTFPQRTQPDDEQSYGCDSAHVGIWPAEPRLGRVVNGCANRVDRIRLLGNGVVPQCAAKAWAVLSEELLGS